MASIFCHTCRCVRLAPLNSSYTSMRTALFPRLLNHFHHSITQPACFLSLQSLLVSQSHIQAKTSNLIAQENAITNQPLPHPMDALDILLLQRFYLNKLRSWPCASLKNASVSL